MDNNNPDPESTLPSRRLTFSAEDFDDYLITLTAKLRFNSTADRVLSGELVHPLVVFQRDNLEQLQALEVPFVSPQALLQDPVTPYINWLRILTAN